jgi:hypothetical protein
MIKFLKKYIPWAMIAILVFQVAAILLGIPFLSAEMVTILGIIGWISYIEIAQFDTEA